jgi:nitrite reductase/ring-hydroxylating ferredoxin subunit
MPWHRAAAVADCPPGKSLEVVIDDRVIALFNIDDQFYAVDGVCPHQGGPLAEGAVANCIATCPWHGWQFDIRTGQNLLNPNIIQPHFETNVESADVYVNVPER